MVTAECEWKSNKLFCSIILPAYVYNKIIISKAGDTCARNLRKFSNKFLLLYVDEQYSSTGPIGRQHNHNCRSVLKNSVSFWPVCPQFKLELLYCRLYKIRVEAYACTHCVYYIFRLFGMQILASIDCENHLNSRLHMKVYYSNKYHRFTHF